MRKISVIIPTYNREQYLQRSLDSVLAQTYKDFEILVVNDGSTDNTAGLLKGFNPKVKSLNLPQNLGVSAARNLAAREAKGEWLCFLDSDDEWLPEKLEKQIKYAETHSQHPLIHGEEIWVRKGIRVNAKKKHKKMGGRIFANCVPLCCISPSTAMIRKDLFFSFGGFREDYPVCEDYDLWLKVCAKYEVGFIEEPIIIKYGGHEDQLSQKYKAMDYWRVKSLENFLHSDDISTAERALVAETIRKKSQILLEGYKKHDNLENFREISEIYKQVDQSI